MKVCTKCQVAKDESEFYITTHTGKPTHPCKECKYKFAEIHRKANFKKDQIRKRKYYDKILKSQRLENTHENAKFIENLKSTTPCKDCGCFFPAVCMDFDHLDPSKKYFSIGHSKGRTREALLKEIAKCELVCANCHRIRTWITRKRKTIVSSVVQEVNSRLLDKKPSNIQAP